MLMIVNSEAYILKIHITLHTIKAPGVFASKV